MQVELEPYPEKDMGPGCSLGGRAGYRCSGWISLYKVMKASSWTSDNWRFFFHTASYNSATILEFTFLRIMWQPDKSLTLCSTYLLWTKYIPEWNSEWKSGSSHQTTGNKQSLKNALIFPFV
jgi:hypothetical protein